MYQIYADNVLIYDSTIDDYKLGKGSITLEADKSGSFVFTLYPDHFFYKSFVKLKTVVTVKKSGRIVFRGRVLNDVGDYWNAGTFTCEGELGFLRDSVIRPFEFQGTPAALFKHFIDEHNEQVDEFKRFKVGTVTVQDGNDYINRSTAEYPTTFDVLASALTGSDLGGHFYITHDDDDPIPTLHYVGDYPNTAMQSIEFGVNLKDYTRTTKAEDVATAIIPLGTETGSNGQRLTIADVNGGKDYIYDADAVAARGWVFKTVVWEDVTLAQNLLTKAQAYLAAAINQAVTIELNAIDLHLLDRSIESFRVCDYVNVRSAPHGVDAVMLCSKQTMDLLKPESDTVVLGYHTTTFTDTGTYMAANVETLGKKVSSIKQTAEEINLSVKDLEQDVENKIQTGIEGITLSATAGSNQSTIKVMANGIEVDSAVVKFSNITADSVAASNITGSLTSDKIKLYGDLTVYQNYLLNSSGGSLGYTSSSKDGSGGIHLASSGSEVRATNTGAALHGSGGGRVVCTNNCSITGNYIFFNAGDGCEMAPNRFNPLSDWGMDLGMSGQRWGTLYCGAVNDSSDRALKTDIEYGLDKYSALFDALKPCSYRFIREGEDGKTNTGFIAQDIDAALTEVGLTRQDFAGLAMSEQEGASGLVYNQFIALLIDQVQKLKKRIAALEEKEEG